MTRPTIDLRTLTQEADDAFWQVVVRQYPQAKTGDLSPLTTFALHQAEEEAVKEWVWANVPESRCPATPTYFNEPDGHTYWLDAVGDLMAAPTLLSGEVDWECSVYVDDFDEPLTQRERTSIINRLRTPKDPERGD